MTDLKIETKEACCATTDASLACCSTGSEADAACCSTSSEACC